MVRKSGRKNCPFRNAIVGIAAALLAVTGALAPAPPARASLGECGAGSTCVWSGANYATDWGTVGGFINFTWCIDDLGNYFNINNKATSVFNRGNTDTAYLYDYPNKAGSRITILRGTGKSDLRAVGFNDRASSGYFTSGLTKAGTATCN
ncbi:MULTISPECIES: peptidase inhibitor family I36 protein [Microbacterium]|uniref:peptidase inhibitor family I36 protein n=1 Tax=Microbacterium TaxID=33882 RepID=UPI0011EB25EA|nr:MULTISPECIES: peptidase inhibitor family I36 protein [Microbacterium]